VWRKEVVAKAVAGLQTVVSARKAAAKEKDDEVFDLKLLVESLNAS